MPKRGKKGGKTAIRHSENFPRSRATVILSLASCSLLSKNLFFPSF